MMVRYFFKLIVAIAAVWSGPWSVAFADALSDLIQKYSQQKSTPSTPSVRQVSSKTKSKPINYIPKSFVQPEPVTSVTESKPATPIAVAPPEITAAPEDTMEVTGLFGDWGGIRSLLRKSGVELAIAYRGELFSNMAGGLRQKTVYLSWLDVSAFLDLEKMAGLKGSSLVLNGWGADGPNPSEFVGDNLYSSYLESANTGRLYEAYFKQNLDDHFWLLAGLRDIGGDFYKTDSSSGLKNFSFYVAKSLGQAGFNGPPSFPNTALALSAKYESSRKFYFQTAIFNGTSGRPGHRMGTQITTNNDHGYLNINEIGYASPQSLKIGVGAWQYTEAIATIEDASASSQNWGFYTVIDRNLTKKFSAFFRHGIANPRVNRFSQSTELGVSCLGCFAGRTKDRFSLGAASGVTSHAYRHVNGSDDGEYAIEINYRIEAFRGVSFTPDYQYLVNPGQSRAVQDAHVGVLHMEVAF